ncbi:MAG: hypothetical protein K940chlam7_00023 [Chlamydiae bacterium]|nr:hypothetical protein [Chlamydiota bacterium]
MPKRALLNTLRNSPFHFMSLNSRGLRFTSNSKSEDSFLFTLATDLIMLAINEPQNQRSKNIIGGKS